MYEEFSEAKLPPVNLHCSIVHSSRQYEHNVEAQHRIEEQKATACVIDAIQLSFRHCSARQSIDHTRGDDDYNFADENYPANPVLCLLPLLNVVQVKFVLINVSCNPDIANLG